MPSTIITINHARPVASLLPWPVLPDDPHTVADGLSGLLAGIAGGLVEATVTVNQGSTATSAAIGYVKLISGTGTITVTINGVAIPVTWASSDTNTASLLAAAINASTHPLVTGIVKATASGTTCTIRAIAPGKVGNSITLAASGTGAIASGPRLSGGYGADVAGSTFGAPAIRSARFSQARNTNLAGAFLLTRLM